MSLCAVVRLGLVVIGPDSECAWRMRDAAVPVSPVAGSCAGDMVMVEASLGCSLALFLLWRAICNRLDVKWKGEGCGER